jgi:hypothetical protein
MDLKRVCAEIETGLAEALADGDYDITVDEDGGEATVETDEWTLQLASIEGALSAFLAIDDEPENEASYATAVRSALGASAMDAFAGADLELKGMLSAALLASGDPFSAEFAGLIRARA